MRKLKLEVLLETAIILPVIVLVIMLAGCNVGNNAIFYTLEHEEKIIDNTLPNNIDVLGIVRDGDYYYAAAGGIYRASVSGRSNSGWKLIDSVDTNSTSLGLCNSLVPFGGKYYAAFFKDETNGNISYGLYSTTSLSSSVVWDGPLGTDSDIKSKQITGLFDVNGNLIVAIYNSTNKGYDLYYSGDGTSFSKVTLGGITGSLVQNVSDISYFGGKYWVLSGSKILNGTSISSLSEIATSSYPSDVTPSAQYEGILASTAFSSNLLYLSDNMGEIFTSSDGVSWTRFSDSPIEVSSNSVPFGRFIQASNDLLLVATEGYGFYKITQTNSITRFSDNTKANLYNGVILGFYVDTTDSNIFIYTAGSGLWSNTLSGISDDKSWQWE